MAELLEEATLADSLGLDVFAVGEHHRPDYLVSSPATVLAAIAARTETIRLSSAVTVLSSDDPVRVFQQFAELDLISGGRAEIMAGRGSFTESFPLFGYRLEDYEALFEEKLDLLLRLRKDEPVVFSGRFCPPLDGVVVYPRPLQSPLPVWRAVGASPESVERAARASLPLMLAIIGGSPENFVLLTELYRQLSSEPIGVTSHGLIADSLNKANSAFAGPYLTVMNRIGRERGWRPATNAQYQFMTSTEGHLVIGSPEEAAAKIIHQYQLLGNERFLLHSSIGAVSHKAVLRSIELLAREVKPRVEAWLQANAAELTYLKPAAGSSSN